MADSDELERIVEERDADDKTGAIREINTGTMCFDTRLMFDALQEVGNDNAQGEFYVTDTIGILHRRGLRVSVVRAANPGEVLGVNSIEQLQALAAKIRE